MLIDRITNRWQAFAIHLAISIVIFLLLAAVIYRWYPGVLFKYDGGLEGVKLIAGVDLVIGPLLTLLVYNTAKKSLKMDLSIIALLQAACLIGGMWTIYQTRPIAVVFSDGAYMSVSSLSFQESKVDYKNHPLLQGDWPVFVAVDNKYPIMEGKRGLVNPQRFLAADHYQTIEVNKTFIISAGARLSELKSFPEGHREDAVANSSDNTLFYPAAFGNGAGMLAVNRNNMAFEEFYLDFARSDSLIKQAIDKVKSFF